MTNTWPLYTARLAGADDPAAWVGDHDGWSDILAIATKAAADHGIAVIVESPRRDDDGIRRSAVAWPDGTVDQFETFETEA